MHKFIYRLHIKINMKTINLYLEDAEYDALTAKKKGLTWREFVLGLGE